LQNHEAAQAKSRARLANKTGRAKSFAESAVLERSPKILQRNAINNTPLALPPADRAAVPRNEIVGRLDCVKDLPQQTTFREEPASIENGRDDDAMTELDNHREERRLDGSRDYWQFREGGQFGSHPSYDDVDDESDP
jgi:hypothetical protein